MVFENPIIASLLFVPGSDDTELLYAERSNI